MILPHDQPAQEPKSQWTFQPMLVLPWKETKELFDMYERDQDAFVGNASTYIADKGLVGKVEAQGLVVAYYLYALKLVFMQLMI